MVFLLSIVAGVQLGLLTSFYTASLPKTCCAVYIYIKVQYLEKCLTFTNMTSERVKDESTDYSKRTSSL